MDVQEFLDLDYLSHSSCEAFEFGGRNFLILTLGFTDPDQTRERRVRFVLDHHRADQLSRGLSNGIQGVYTLG